MREPLPYITGPGSVFGIFLFLYLYLNGYINFSNASMSKEWILLIAGFAVIIAPIFNMLFHMLWIILTNGYQNIGFQRELVKKLSREEAALTFEKSFIFPNKNEVKYNHSDTIDYARRRSAAYLMNLQFRWAILVALIIFLILNLYKNGFCLNLTIFIIVIISVAIFVVSWCFTEKRIQPEAFNFEKEVIESNTTKAK